MKPGKVFSTSKPGLYTLAIGGISIGMAEFMMMGVLPDVAGNLGISIPQAGHLISIYALGVVVGAPLMVGIAANYPPKKVLIILMLMLAVFNGLFAFAPGIRWLLAARFLSGLPHGAFFGIGAVVASRLAESGKEASAVAIMFAGLTIANIFGVPLGTYISHHFNWRVSFMIISVIALLAAGSVAKWLPFLAAPPHNKFTESLKVFRKPEPWLVLGISSIGTGGLFAWISYIAPLMTEVAGFHTSMITYIMVVAGIGMAVGNFVGGRLGDRFSPVVATRYVLVSMIFALLIVAVVSQYQVPAVIMTFITGAVAFAIIAPMQMLMISVSKGSEMLASSSIQASANLGNALGAWLGGLPIAAGFGYTSPEYVGAALAFTGLLFCIALNWRFTSRAQLSLG